MISAKFEFYHKNVNIFYKEYGLIRKIANLIGFFIDIYVATINYREYHNYSSLYV